MLLKSLRNMNWRTKVLAAALITVIGASVLFAAFYFVISFTDGAVSTGDDGNKEYSNEDNRTDPDELGNDTFGEQNESEISDLDPLNGSGDRNDPPTNDDGQPVDNKGTGNNEGTEYNTSENEVRSNDDLVRSVGMVMAGSVLMILLALVVFSFTRIRSEELLKQKKRMAIYTYIIEHPGDHFRAVQRAVGLQIGVLSHHINILEKEQLIVSEQDGNNRRFYAAGVKRSNGEVRLSRVQENILKSIQATPGITQSEIAKDLGVNRKVVFYNVKFLSGSGIVTEQKLKRRAHYYPNELA